MGQLEAVQDVEVCNDECGKRRDDNEVEVAEETHGDEFGAVS